MKNYGVFYSFNKEKDSLIVRFSDLNVTYQKALDHVIVSFHNLDIVSYRIKNINKIIKIHADGLIPVVNEQLLTIINSLLEKDGLPTLENKSHSDFYNGEVISVNPIIIKTILNEYKFEDLNVKLHDHVVVLKPRSFDFHGNYYQEAHVCTYEDLDISSSNEIFKDNELQVEDDFFLTMEG